MNGRENTVRSARSRGCPNSQQIRTSERTRSPQIDDDIVVPQKPTPPLQVWQSCDVLSGMSRLEHWEHVHRNKPVDEVSWYAPHLNRSIDLVRRTGATAASAIVDVGAGTSTLADDLTIAGYTNVAVMDLSFVALQLSRERLGTSAANVKWIQGDVISAPFLPNSVDVWHDRAVFHFLTRPDDRAAYVETVHRAVRPNGHVIIATFGPDGPTRCSGLDVMRYSPEQLHGEFGSGFRLIEHTEEAHRTPFGTEQQFVYCYCRVS